MLKPKLIIGFLVVILLIGVVTYFVLTEKEEKVYRVGILSALRFFDPLIPCFKEGMTELGYVEGKNIFYDIQLAPSPVGNEDFVKKFVDEKVDLILVYPTEVTLEAKAVTKGTEMPLITCAVITEAVIKDFRYPGENVTGVHMGSPEIAGQRLEILLKLAPHVKRIWIPHLKDYPTVSPQIELLQDTAARLGLTIIPAPFTSPEEVKADFKAREASGKIGFDAIIMLSEPYTVTPPVVDIIDAFADKHKIPIASALVRKPNHELGLTGDDYGPVFGLTPNNCGFGTLSAPLADKIFRGVPVGTIPVVTAENELQINLKVLQKLGLEISEDLLSRATVIVR